MRKFQFFVLFLMSFRSSAQVAMTVQLPPVGVLQKAQLWNIVLISTSTRPVNVRVALRVSDAQTNQPLFTGVTRSIMVIKGAKQLQVSDVMPVQYEYLSPDVDRSVNGFLAAGNFLVCYSLLLENGDKGLGQPGEDCIPFAVEPVSPPLLNSPAHLSLLETNRPQFSWIPPAPMNLFTDLNYELVLTEVHAGQSPEEAVQQNIKIFKAPYLKNIFVNYPSGAMALDTAKNYAWTVVAKNGQKFAAQTEVWTFRIKGSKLSGLFPNQAFVQLKRTLDGSVTVCSGALQFAYNNVSGDGMVRYEILALASGNSVVQKGEVNLSPGANMLRLELKSGVGMNQYYLFRLRNGRQESWQMKFINTGE